MSARSFNVGDRVFVTPSEANAPSGFGVVVKLRTDGRLWPIGVTLDVGGSALYSEPEVQHADNGATIDQLEQRLAQLGAVGTSRELRFGDRAVWMTALMPKIGTSPSNKDWRASERDALEELVAILEARAAGAKETP